MLATCWSLAVANVAVVVAGVIVGTSPAQWVLNATCAGVIGFMGFVVWDDTR